MERLEHRMIPRIDKLGHDAALGWLHLGDHRADERHPICVAADRAAASLEPNSAAAQLFDNKFGALQFERVLYRQHPVDRLAAMARYSRSSEDRRGGRRKARHHGTPARHRVRI
jgi:hypothetical protein